MPSFDTSTPDTTTPHPATLRSASVRSATVTHGTSRRTVLRTVGRWMVSFAGYPLGGYAAFLLTGRVDAPDSALTGGLLTGLILGAVQAWAMGPARPGTRSWAWSWSLATGVGLMVGVAAGAALVSYETDLGSLVLQGAVSGAVVGIAQAAVLYRRLGDLVLAWPFFLTGTFALGWATTTSAGIDVDQQFTMFGSSGALVAALLTSALPLVLRASGQQVSQERGLI
jgi:hypothetical protein